MKRPGNWDKIIELDDERREIQERIRIRAKKHHTGRITDEEAQKLTGSTVWEDAARYIEIQDLQWSLLGLHDSGLHEQPPL